MTSVYANAQVWRQPTLEELMATSRPSPFPVGMHPGMLQAPSGPQTKEQSYADWLAAGNRPGHSNQAPSPHWRNGNEGFRGWTADGRIDWDYGGRGQSGLTAEGIMQGVQWHGANPALAARPQMPQPANIPQLARYGAASGYDTGASRPWGENFMQTLLHNGFAHKMLPESDFPGEYDAMVDRHLNQKPWDGKGKNPNNGAWYHDLLRLGFEQTPDGKWRLPEKIHDDPRKFGEGYFDDPRKPVEIWNDREHRPEWAWRTNLGPKTSGTMDDTGRLHDNTVANPIGETAAERAARLGLTFTRQPWDRRTDYEKQAEAQRQANLAKSRANKPSPDTPYDTSRAEGELAMFGRPANPIQPSVVRPPRTPAVQAPPQVPQFPPPMPMGGGFQSPPFNPGGPGLPTPSLGRPPQPQPGTSPPQPQMPDMGLQMGASFYQPGGRHVLPSNQQGGFYQLPGGGEIPMQSAFPQPSPSGQGAMRMPNDGLDHGWTQGWRSGPVIGMPGGGSAAGSQSPHRPTPGDHGWDRGWRSDMGGLRGNIGMNYPGAPGGGMPQPPQNNGFLRMPEPFGQQRPWGMPPSPPQMTAPPQNNNWLRMPEQFQSSRKLPWMP